MTSLLARAAAWGLFSLIQAWLQAVRWAIARGAARVVKAWTDFQLWVLAAYEVEDDQ